MTTRREDDRDSMLPVSGSRREPDDNDPPPGRHGGYRRQTVMEAALKAFIRSVGSSLGRILARSLTGRRR